MLRRLRTVRQIACRKEGRERLSGLGDSPSYLAWTRCLKPRRELSLSPSDPVTLSRTQPCDVSYDTLHQGLNFEHSIILVAARELRRLAEAAS